MKQIINLQNREFIRKNNNFFLSYFCDTFNKYIINSLSKKFIIKYK